MQLKFYFTNNVEGDSHWLVKIKLVKTFGLANQRKFIWAKISSSTVYTMSIHLIYYRQVLVDLISIYTYIDSLRHISHHDIICTHDHLLVDPYATCDRSLSKGELSRQ